LSDANRLTGSTEVFAQTAGQLPKLVKEEREAAINQVFDRLATERTNLLASLASKEGEVRDLLAETRATLGSGAEMADSVDAAIQSLDAYTRYVSRLRQTRRRHPRTVCRSTSETMATPPTRLAAWPGS